MKNNITLIIGDIIAFAILTVIGFSTHGEMGLSFLPRMGAIFFPMLFGWFLLSPWLGLFDEQIISNPKNLWRVILSIVFVAPLAATLRAAILGAAMLPLFSLILGGSNALGMIVWRWLYIFIARRVSK